MDVVGGKRRLAAGHIDMTRIPLVRSADEITAAWMQRALAAGGASDLPEIDAVEIQKLSEVTNALGNLFRCRLIARGGGAANPASVVVKLPTSHSLAFRLAKWLSLHRREHVYYRDIARHCDVRTPSLLYGDFDSKSHRFVLVLEDLGGMETIRQIDGVGAERALSAIRAIARLQGRFWDAANEPALAACGAFLTGGEGRIMQTLYLLTLPVAFERFGDVFTTDTHRLAEEFGSRIVAQFAAVGDGPKTVVHGDYRGDNVLFGDGANGDLAVIDWQGCGIGCGMYDVAFFLGTSVSIDDRRRIERDAVGEYHDIVCQMGATNFTRDDCWRSYRQNMLSTLMPMVIGSGGIDMSDRALRDQTRGLLTRTLTAIEDLDAQELLPAPDRYLSRGGGFSILSRCGYSAYTFLLRMRKGRAN